MKIMVRDRKEKHLELLKNSELQYKYALGLGVTNPRLQYLTIFSYGKHTARIRELRLNKDQEEFAVICIEHTAIYIMAVQIDSVLSETIEDRFNHKNNDVKSAAWIARLVRNSFAHNPFAPTWKIYRECDNKIYKVRNIISLNTKGLNNKPVKRMDYGGPLALLYLSRFVRNEIEKT
jgi:hypothetical protein